MAAVKAGDRVQIVTREVTNEDQKSGLYYSYFGGLTGTVDRVYDDNTVCIDIDLDSLSEETRERHLQMQENQRKKWLDSLSGEVRNRLTAEQKQLRISYKLLVGHNDVVPYKGDKPRSDKKSTKTESGDESSAANEGPARAPEPGAGQKDGPPAVEEVQEQVTEARSAKKAAEEASRRLSEADLAAREEEYLKQIQGRSQ